MKRKKTSRRPCNHRYPTRFKLRINAEDSQKVFGGDYVARLHELVSCKRTRNTGLYIPKDLMFDILAVGPAEVVYDVLRLVCWEWYHIVKQPSFVTAHVQLAPTGILLQDLKSGPVAFYMEAKSAGLEVTPIRLPFSAHVCGSCCGFMLLQKPKDRVIHVVNPITKVKLSLPPLHWPLISKLDSLTPDLAYTLRGHYKVVQVWSEYESDTQIFVCTVGIDRAWRLINPEQLSLSVSEMSRLLTRKSCCVGGFVYWHCRPFKFVVALDVDAETMSRLPIPEGIKHSDHLRSLVNIGTTLGLVSHFFGGPQSIWKLWKLVDIESGKWTNELVIDFGAIWSKADTRICLGNSYCVKPFYVENGEVWFQSCETVLIYYNTRSGDVFFYETKAGFDAYSHVNSLLPLKRF